MEVLGEPFFKIDSQSFVQELQEGIDEGRRHCNESKIDDLD